MGNCQLPSKCCLLRRVTRPSVLVASTPFLRPGQKAILRRTHLEKRQSCRRLWQNPALCCSTSRLTRSHLIVRHCRYSLFRRSRIRLSSLSSFFRTRSHPPCWITRGNTTSSSCESITRGGGNMPVELFSS